MTPRPAANDDGARGLPSARSIDGRRPPIDTHRRKNPQGAEIAPEPFAPFDFCNPEAKLLVIQLLRRTAPEFAATPTSIHTSHEFFRAGA
jgi:hypothetical protein